jgi:GntR family transcriptional repressor for pyruvate dehydrogenase complex
LSDHASRGEKLSGGSQRTEAGTPVVAPIERRKVYELVAERLGEQIGAGLAVGAPLPPERELAETYAVGRSSVREALRMLESRGLIESRGNGTFVAASPGSPLGRSLGLLIASDQGGARELFEVRRVLECEAAALAAVRRTNEQLKRLEQAIDEMEAALDSHDDYIAADIGFHLVIAQATGNRVIVHLMHAIRDQLLDLFGTVFHVPGGPQRSVDQHRQIASAISMHQPERARQLMHEHISRVERELDESAAAGAAN